jgi:hypothetical protein
VVLVDIWEGVGARGEAERFREIWGIEGTILLDETAAYAELLDIRGVPTNVLVDGDGIVQAVGLVRLNELQSAVDELLGR